jgi:hypothetical protein
MHMDEMLAYINEYKRLHGYDGGDKIAQHIMALDRDGTLGADERERMVAVYRTLNIIRKNGAAALGLALRENAPLTLGGLMDAAKAFERRKGRGESSVDVSVDDARGRFEKSAKGGIRAILGASGEKGTTYPDILAEALTDKAAPDNLRELLRGQDVLNQPLEDVIDKAGDMPPFSPDISHAAQSVRVLSEASPTLIHYLMGQGIPVTQGNLNAARRLSRSETALADALNEALPEKGANDWKAALPDSSLAPLREGATQDALMNGLWEALDAALPTERVQAAKGLAELQSGLSGEQGEGDIDFPILINGQAATFRVYMLNERAVASGEASAFFSLDAPSLGRVQGYFNIADGNIDIRFSAAADALERLERGQGVLMAMLLDAGVGVGELVFETGEAAYGTG